ncbi:MAG: AmmeMemoRadiSam system protein B [Denitrovibrio sp.]|nr:MAG: AmmeMemoRadiSam system protein B [Denitrovibrio sp.]
MHRQSAVAGVFYPADAESVKNFIKKHSVENEKQQASAVLVPHAGYVYSGATAVRTLSRITIPNTVILAGPNHTGAGPMISVYTAGSWHTPLGEVSMNEELIEKLTEHELFSKDVRAHVNEHSLEVILPILKYFNPDVKVVCITLKYLDIEDIKKAADHISECTDGLFVISSDFNHFEDSETTELKDKAAIDKLLKMDAEGLYSIVSDMRISMCGVVPSCTGILYALSKGADESVFIEHTHSGKVNGDNNKVVGYAGLYYK